MASIVTSRYSWFWSPRLLVVVLWFCTLSASVDGSSESSQRCRDCPSGWHCGDSCYYINRTPGTWQQARDVCLSQGADLVVINSGEEQAYIRGLARDATWIGLTWSGRRWTWVDSTRLTTQYWSVGEPDDHESRDCAALTTSDSRKWANFKCSRSFSAICEKSIRL